MNDAEITITDDDTRGVTVSAISLDVDEGNTANYTVALDSQPTGNVTVTPSSGDTGAVTVSPEMLTFTVNVDDDENASQVIDMNVLMSTGFAVRPVPSGQPVDEPGVRSKRWFDGLPDEAVHGPGAVLTITLYYGSMVTVAPEPGTGALPELVLDVYGRERRARYSGGSGTNLLTFQWTVERGDYDPHGIEIKSIELNGATIEDGGGNPAVPVATFPSGTLTAHVVRGGYFQTQISVPGTAREGEPFTIRATRDGNLDEHAFAAVDVVDSALTYVLPVAVEIYPTGGKLSDGTIADGTSGYFTFTPPPDGLADPDGERTMTIRLHDTASSSVGAEGGVWYEAAGTLEVMVKVEDNELSVDAPVLAVGPAVVHEPESGTVPLRFRVCLWVADELCPGAGKNAAFEAWQGVAHRVDVDYAASDGTARVGAEDYRATSGTLVFEPGETVKTVEVVVLADEHDEGIETVWLTLSNPVGATIGRYRNFGQIHNSGSIPKAWTARFGRTVAGQAIEAVEGRIRASRHPHAEVSLGGHPTWLLGPVFGQRPGGAGRTGRGARMRPRPVGGQRTWRHG